MSGDLEPLDAATVAQQLAALLDERRQPYAFGGAIALGFWAIPRGTIDVDLTLFLSPDKPSECIWLLQGLGCELSVSDALRSLQEHGFCRIRWRGTQVDVFLPLTDFYVRARQRRRQVELGQQSISIWDAESLVVFKMMFFRRKDIADVEQILRTQGRLLDRTWIQQQLEAIYGARDPRLAQWNELVREVSP